MVFVRMLGVMKCAWGRVRERDSNDCGACERACVCCQFAADL